MGARFKWVSKPKKQHKVGDNRTVSKFLLFPKCLDGEYRWLGWERVVQVYRSVMCLAPGSAPIPFKVEKWVDVRWTE